ncbi:centrosomal protein of 131 kDa isoform X3 [Cebus imitator]|uniref:centrosomal protein of 131 kDa isoform X3 n=1 Tax=Cebus imitator TaxID=2715852 RepID=UPI00080A6F4E|nr:centrosomal protein of 131 kDa isoform X3 [Cebus imitator]
MSFGGMDGLYPWPTRYLSTLPAFLLGNVLLLNRGSRPQQVLVTSSRLSSAGTVACSCSAEWRLLTVPSFMECSSCSLQCLEPLTRSKTAPPLHACLPSVGHMEATGPGDSRAINNLRRSNSTTQVSQPRNSSPRLTEPTDFLTLFEGSPSGRKRLASLRTAPSEKGATWNVLDDRPRDFTLPSNALSSSALDSPAGPRRKECPVTLAPNFTANNRSNKAAVGNCVTTMVHNCYTPSERAPPLKSSNQTAPSLNNILKAATREGSESSGFGKPPKNISSATHSARNNAGGATSLPGRKEVTEEEAERFIHQVNQAAVTIQRWYRQQVQQRRAGAARLQHLPQAEREEQRQLLGEGTLLDLHQQKEAARRKAREEKARQARRAAIQELQQKRAQRAQKASTAERGLPENPQETRAPGMRRPAQEPSPTLGGTAHQALKANNAGAGLPAAGPGDRCPLTSDSSPEPRQPPEDRMQDVPAQDAAGDNPEMVAPSRGSAKSGGPLEELLHTLQLLEKEPEPLPCPTVRHKGRYAWASEVAEVCALPCPAWPLEDDASSLTADNLEKFGKLSAFPEPPEDGTLLSEAKLQSIMSFLDEMEKSGQDQLDPQQEGQVPQAGLGPLEPGSEVGTSVMRLKLEVEEKKQAMLLLQRALAQQRDLTVRRVKETEKALSRQLQRQREHYEATIQRHLAFIDQLIEDKKILSEKCEAVVAELKQEDQRCSERVAQAQEQHELEIKKLKEIMSATEKVRREKWISEKTKKIKEITVRGLEPEIQKLIARHKQEVRRLKSLHEAELLQSDERASQRCLRQAEELREQLEREKEALGQQERERARQRFQQHLEQEQWALQQQRQRLYSEVAEEKERLGQQAARQRAELEELRQQLEESSSALTRALRAEFEKGREEQELRHQMELKALKQQLELERQAWEASSARKEAWLLNREQELREEIRKGRDKEIELVVHRLEADMALAKEESERAAESRIKRLRDKYEAELLELEQSERRLQERCSELKGQLGEAEGENLHLQGLVRQKERALEDVQAMNQQLNTERSNVAQVIRQEFQDRLAASEEETRQARAELAALQARQQLELEEVHRRVKTALARKEEAVSSLRTQHEAAVKRAAHLEELLEQHRRPALSSK